jgi:hypothetical protein
MRARGRGAGMGTSWAFGPSPFFISSRGRNLAAALRWDNQFWFRRAISGRSERSDVSTEAMIWSDRSHAEWKQATKHEPQHMPGCRRSH